MFPIRDHNPSGITPYVTYTLIALNILVFVAMLPYTDNPGVIRQIYSEYAMIPARLSAEQGYGTLVTSMFLHAGFMHLAGNMLFLYIFGDNLEDEMGHLPYLGFYLASGMLAGLAHYLTAPMSHVPTVGASGAIAGVMGGYLLLFPKARVDVLLILIIIFKIIPIPAWIVLALWFALQIFGGIGADASQGGVAHWAHSGGFVAGFLLTLPVFFRRGGMEFWQRTEGHPPHPAATYEFRKSPIPKIPRRK